MATTTEIPGIHSVSPPQNGTEPPAEPKRPRGRPHKCRQCGENIDPTKQHVCTPEPAAQDAGDEDFWLMLSNFSPEEWNRLTAYLYRVMPRIDRKANGKPINLGAYSTAFTRDDIMQEHGSGVYRIDVTQLEPASSRSHRIAREVFTIINPKYPPIVPAGDWVDDKVNDMWKWGAPPGTQSNAGIAAGYPPGFNMEAVMERTEKGLKMGLEMAKAMTPPPAPVKDDSALITLLTTLIMNKPEPAKVDTTATDALLKFLEKQNDRLADELKELRNKPVAAQGNILTQVKELRPVLTEFVEIFAAKNGGDQPWWAAPLEKLMEGVGEAIPTVVTMMKAGQQQQQNGAREHQWNPQLAAAQTQPQPTAQTQPQPTASAPSTATAAQPDLTDEQKRLQSIYQKWGQFILFISPQMVSDFKTDREGHGGYHFRDWFLEGHGKFKWVDLKREVGAAVLASMIADHPAMKVEMAPEPQRLFFIQEFFTEVGEELDVEEELDGDEKVINIGGNDAA